MSLLNSRQQFGTISKLIHWIAALTVIALFALGTWMVDLTYYSSWYKPAPHYHKSVGILLLLLTLFRVIWKLSQPHPDPLSSHTRFEKLAASMTHLAIYCLLFLMFISGYLISTLEGVGIEVFDWFILPSILQAESSYVDLAGEIHEIVGWSLISIVSLHALAAIKHHFVDKDTTLRRMLFFGKN